MERIERRWLKLIRKKHKLTQYAISSMLGISQSYYSSIETGGRGATVKLAKRIGKILEFDWRKFYDDEDI